MSKRILVAYATRGGTTIGVASAIGEALGERGFTADVMPVSSDLGVADYQAVVIGSAVNGGQWLPEAVEFVKAHRDQLRHVPTAVFCVHIMNLRNDERSRRNRLAYLDAVRAIIRPADEAFFAGMGMKPDEKSLLMRWGSRLFNIPAGDCRDWGKIRGWGERVFG